MLSGSRSVNGLSGFFLTIINAKYTVCELYKYTFDLSFPEVIFPHVALIGVFFKDKCAWLDKEHGSFLITQTKCAGFFFYNYVCVFNCFVVINLSIHISSLNSGADRLDCYRMNVETYLTQQCTSN